MCGAHQMLRALLLLYTLVVSSCSSPCVAQGRHGLAPRARSAYTSPSERFALEVPPGWTVRDTSYTVAHYLHVFLLLWNDVATLDKIDDLPTGGVKVMFTRSGFMRTGFFEDTVGDSLSNLVDTLKTKWGSSSGGSWHIVGFQKWNDWWSIRAWARDLTGRDRQAVDALIRSVVFSSDLVTLPGQAVQLAFKKHLPLDVRAHHDSCGVTSDLALRDKVTQQGKDFLVTFHTVDSGELAGTPSSTDSMPSWSYVVKQDGTVWAIK